MGEIIIQRVSIYQQQIHYNKLKMIMILKYNNTDNDIKIKEEIIVNEENTNSENEHMPITNKMYVAGVSLKCIDCDQLFYFQEDFQNHMTIEHDTPKPYKCNKCHKCYKNKGKVIRHIEMK
eukprot:128430_1